MVKKVVLSLLIVISFSLSGLCITDINNEKTTFSDIKLKSESIDKSDVSVVENKLIGINHEEYSIFNALNDIPNNGFIKALPLREFIKLLF